MAGSSLLSSHYIRPPRHSLLQENIPYTTYIGCICMLLLSCSWNLVGSLGALLSHIVYSFWYFCGTEILDLATFWVNRWSKWQLFLYPPICGPFFLCWNDGGWLLHYGEVRPLPSCLHIMISWILSLTTFKDTIVANMISAQAVAWWSKMSSYLDIKVYLTIFLIPHLSNIWQRTPRNLIHFFLYVTDGSSEWRM